MIHKAERLVGMRNAKSLRNIWTLQLLYFALVRSNLELEVLIWNPYSAAPTTRNTERIQRRFLKGEYNYSKTSLERSRLQRGLAYIADFARFLELDSYFYVKMIV